MTKLDSIEIAPDIGTIVEATPEEEETTIDSVQIVGVPLLHCRCVQGLFTTQGKGWTKDTTSCQTQSLQESNTYRQVSWLPILPTTPLPIRLLDITPDSKALVYIHQW